MPAFPASLQPVLRTIAILAVAGMLAGCDQSDTGRRRGKFAPLTDPIERRLPSATRQSLDRARRYDPFAGLRASTEVPASPPLSGRLRAALEGILKEPPGFRAKREHTERLERVPVQAPPPETGAGTLRKPGTDPSTDDVNVRVP